MADTESKGLSLLELDRQYRDVVELIRGAHGELTPETEAELERAFAALCEKADGYGVVIGRIEAEHELWKRRRDECGAVARVLSNHIESLKTRMRLALLGQPNRSLQGEVYRFSLIKSRDSLVLEEQAIPPQYKTTRITLEANKDLIEKDLKAGVIIPGASLKTDNYSLRSGRPK